MLTPAPPPPPAAKETLEVFRKARSGPLLLERLANLQALRRLPAIGAGQVSLYAAGCSASFRARVPRLRRPRGRTPQFLSQVYEYLARPGAKARSGGIIPAIAINWPLAAPPIPLGPGIGWALGHTRRSRPAPWEQT